MVAAASTLPDFTGCIIDEHFELVQMLGSGTYGVVYKAVDKRAPASSPSRYRAIKIICKTGRSATELATIRREVALHTMVSRHPGVVSIYDAFEDDVYCYIILEFCQGGDLFEQICDKKIYENNDELLRGAFVSLVDAVLACHEAKIAHRDLKPENVLSSEDGSRMFLADFGLATNKRMVDDHGAGTSIYMSPECVGELSCYRPYCPRANDVWALGVILLNMISGRNPWSKPTLKDESFVIFLTDPDLFLESFPLSEGAHAILAATFELHPLKRITVRELRKAIVSLDTFFSPEFKHKHARKHEHEHPHHQRADAKRVLDTLGEVALCTPVAPPASGKAAEIDIHVRLPKPAVRERVDCSAGFASDITTTTSSSSCSSSRASFGDSDLNVEAIVKPTASIWEEMMMDAYKKEAAELQWQKGSMAQILMAQYHLGGPLM